MLKVDMPMPVKEWNCLDCKALCVDMFRHYCGITKKTIDTLKNMRARPDWCPIKGVLPDEHGDLIDRDKLLKEIEMYHVSDGLFQHWVELQDAVVGKDDSLPCWADGPDGCEELTYHGMAECLRHCVEGNGTDCRCDCQYVERDTGACLHEYLMSDAADYLDKAAATIEKMKKAIAAERKDDEQIH